jgi:hypothetical protein
MSGKGIYPRPLQIAELTRGYVLPWEAIRDEHMEVIAACLNQEWSELVRTHADRLPTDEVELSSLMCSRLNNLDDPLWRTLVSSVVRDHSVMSFDGSHLEKSPDLSIHLTRRNPNLRLEVECKLIDYPTQKTVALYANQGLLRFVNGEYAWGTREAFMLAYVQDQSTLADRLIPFFEQHQRSGSDPYGTDQLPMPVHENPSLARSTHARKFCYSLQMPSSPGSIAIWHLWLFR